MEALKKYYIRKFYGKVFVLKFGGEILTNPSRLNNILLDVKELWENGIKIAIVYGGGQQADELTRKLGGKVQKIDGRRITGEIDLEVIKMLYGGLLSLELLGAIRRLGIKGVRVSALDGDLIVAKKRPVTTIDYGFVGDIEKVNPEILIKTMRDGYIPVIPAITADKDGNVLNTNADTIATNVAGALKAEKLIFFSNTDGVMAEGKLLSVLTTEEALQLIDEQKITGGMIVKVTNAMEALKAGVLRVQIINGMSPHSLLKEVLTDKGAGTMILQPVEEKRYQKEIQEEFKRISTVELLQELVSIPSPSGQEEMVVKFLLKYLKQHCSHVYIRDRNIWAVKGDGKKVLLLQAHIDTVPVVSGWQGNPFEPLVSGNRLTGCGAAENKASVAAFVHAFLDLECPSDCQVVLALTCEEERGDQGLQRLLSDLPVPNAAIIGEPTGMEIRTGHRGRVVLEGNVHTSGGHTAFAQREENAVIAAMEAVKKIEQLSLPEHPLMGKAGWQVSYFEAGVPEQYNIVPNHVVFQIEGRTVPGVKNSTLIEKAQSVVDFPLKVLINQAEAKIVSPDEKIVMAAKKALNREELCTAGDLTDLHCLECPGIIFGPEGGNIHKGNEWVNIDSMEKVENILPMIIKNYFTACD